jgi:hypothetical protein
VQTKGTRCEIPLAAYSYERSSFCLSVIGALYEQSVSAGGEKRGEITSEAGGSGHRKSNSYTQAPPNADLRTREYLTEAEVERLLKVTEANRWAYR